MRKNTKRQRFRGDFEEPQVNIMMNIFKRGHKTKKRKSVEFPSCSHCEQAPNIQVWIHPYAPK